MNNIIYEKSDSWWVRHEMQICTVIGGLLLGMILGSVFLV